MRSLLAILFAFTALAATPPPDGAMTFQVYGRFGRFVASHTIVPPAEAANLSPVQFVTELESGGRSQRHEPRYWLGPIYRYDHGTRTVSTVYDGKIGKTSQLLVKDLQPDDVILIYVEER